MLVVLALAFSLPVAVAILAGASRASALWAGLTVTVAVSLASVCGSLVRTTMVQELRLTIAAPRERVYDSIRDPRTASRWNPTILSLDGFAGEPGVVGSRWRVRLVNGAVLESEVVAAEPPSPRHPVPDPAVAAAPVDSDGAGTEPGGDAGGDRGASSAGHPPATPRVGPGRAPALLGPAPRAVGG